MSKQRVRRAAAGLTMTLALWVAAAAAQPPPASGLDLRTAFAPEVGPRWQLPDDEQAAYAEQIAAALVQAQLTLQQPQYLLAVDRLQLVQAALLYWRDEDGAWHWIGAVPVSTGRRGGYEHFLTPLGVFEHSIAHLDFRAEGTRNELGIRGYGIEGMRVFDFGWVIGERTWGRGGLSPMRLQVHATDPELLEPRLGTAASKGCIRIPARFNVFLDRYGLLDADYNAALARGVQFWVLRKDRQVTPW